MDYGLIAILIFFIGYYTFKYIKNKKVIFIGIDNLESLPYKTYLIIIWINEFFKIFFNIEDESICRFTSYNAFIF
ncbi:Uncharacterised protein [Clostridium putrefaciens]|uniref:Uncharacterized protein n=1 Tax=Clostridium putrefaciens TaxID=99675 RepID=A0A381JCG1_9CLOT|nr:Uncharacterised protein [Clostridium putrefaciens]